ncbi:MGH1-like glycoside hydrolase domain-containing protein [Dyadobacter aurulentus]|uniref:MGH1-like glycoside hydrolase domain-containing protein n=1 Tax=Dyadobacter sp. UC 10 TaxID=2605428 RepID=UPI0011F39062|nr:glycosyl hydrolase family 65 protein [Dyadobacter sp. UC 10]KAA0989745.1 hypothetical protein FXO21_05990 [Dyadobacter sp. UC 10]
MKYIVVFLICISPFFVAAQKDVLRKEHFEHYVNEFNRNDRELYQQKYPNSEAWAFMEANIPFFECPDKQLEKTYYFRWWTYRKHIRETPEGYVITEFLPNVPWAGKHNTISCPAGHHFYEGRWLHNPVYLADYARFWFKKGGNPRSYSFWAADAITGFCEVQGDYAVGLELLPDLIQNYTAWEKEHLDSTGLYWQKDDRDGMEVSVSGAMSKDGLGYRATINSYQYGDAKAISYLAKLNGDKEVKEVFARKAADIKANVFAQLWDEEAAFFKVIPCGHAHLTKSDARELHGFTPWYFNMPGEKHAVAWQQIRDTSGFAAPFGLTSVERRHPGFRISYEGHECQWNGPSWPFATSVTLTAMANLLNNYQQKYVTQEDYLEALRTYSRAQQSKSADSTMVPWIDENLNPFTGDWISRTRLKSWDSGSWSAGKGGEERGKDYNHSTFCDLVISGLIGIRPQPGNILIVNPLVPENEWDYFCLDRVKYHGKMITVIYDKSGNRYRRGKGFRVLVNGVEKFAADNIQKAEIPL